MAAKLKENQAGLRMGYTSGSCAAAAAEAAVWLLLKNKRVKTVILELPDTDKLEIPVAALKLCTEGAVAAVIKDAGDDPDITDGATIEVRVSLRSDKKIIFLAGEGVGTVSKPGLALEPGEPAINPVPRQMIITGLKKVSQQGFNVEISIPGGKELAAKTFNPRLGVVGGLSILGTSGRVHPRSSQALLGAIKCSLNVAEAAGLEFPVLVPGNIGARAARKNFSLSGEQVIEISNEWGKALDLCADYEFSALLVLGHPGKLAKLIQGDWNTHSGSSQSAVPVVLAWVKQITGESFASVNTVEEIMQKLPAQQRSKVAKTLAEEIAKAISSRPGIKIPVSVMLIGLKGNILAKTGALDAWQ